MKISQMKQILEVLSCGSINKAAQNLYISQSGLSASINAAEKELGQPILVRSHDGISPTPFGIRFMEVSRQILDLYDGLIRSDAPAEPDRLCVSSQFLRYASTIYTNVCTHCGSKETDFRFAEKTSDEILQDLVDRVSDIGIVVTPTVARTRVQTVLSKLGLEGHLVRADDCCCMVGPHSPLYRQESDIVSIRQLKNYPRLDYDTRPWPGGQNIFMEESQFFPNNSLLTISDAGSFYNFLVQTNCYFIGIHNAEAYQTAQFYDNVRVLRLADAEFPYDTIWLRRKGWALTPMTRQFLRLFYEIAGCVWDNHIQ